ncbi:head-tail joining protein [Methylobrevis pamukkalensis]|uniref:Uncharacterized protein n=1 Tax=Methylobrevis pamukkalensis TaxID=1439726 RepID=A0A1E3H248_9HYPH|nr:hypothetical protein [Methylobrevis pamukkalensis]ODN70215.1 hypothetical protein A6302_02489 [Methylobrevis pamukkalensis]
MARTDLGAAHNAAQFGMWGVPASYIPPGEEAGIACTVIVTRPDAMAGFGDGRAVLGRRVLKVRASEVTPAEGGTFVISTGETVTVRAAPRREDPLRQIWTCEVP